MTIGLVGRKCGMTRVFTDAGETVPVTVIQALPNRVVQVKSGESDGYRAVQVTVGARRASRLAKPVAGHFAKQGVEPGESLMEFRLAAGEGAELKPGAELKVDLFQVGQVVDVAGTTIGKGFAGTMKRHGFAGGPASHGASVVHRMGNVRRTVENLRVVEVDVERNLLLVSGSIPGAEGGRVVVQPSVKAAAQARRKTIAPAKK